MRALFPLFSILIFLASQAAFATNPNEYRANFWQLHFSSDYANDPTQPVAFVQAHVGEATFDNDPQGQPDWDQNAALVPLAKMSDHFYSSFAIEHTTSPEITGGYRGAIVQYHYFLQGEESQIDPQNPYNGGHWTAPVLYLDGTSSPTSAGPGAPFTISDVIVAMSFPDYQAKKQTAAAAMPADAQATAVVEVQYDFAD